MANYNRTLGFGSFPTRGGFIDRIPYSAAFDGTSGYLSKDFGSAGNRRRLFIKRKIQMRIRVCSD